jgi:hypothetical protein
MILLDVRQREEGARKPSVIHTLAFDYPSIRTAIRNRSCVASRDNALLDRVGAAVHNNAMKAVIQ